MAVLRDLLSLPVQRFGRGDGVWAGWSALETQKKVEILKQRISPGNGPVEDWLLPKEYCAGFLAPVMQFLKNQAELEQRSCVIEMTNDIKVIIDACLQRAQLSVDEPTSFQALSAMQAVVTDIYEYAMHQLTVPNPPFPPLVTWIAAHKTRPFDTGVYMLKKEEIQRGGIDIQIDIACLSELYRMRGISAWIAMSHKAVSHAIVKNQAPLLKDIQDSLLDDIIAKALLPGLLAERVEQDFSDVLGTLMNPTLGIGLFAYFRGIGELILDENIRRVGVIVGTLEAMGRQQRTKNQTVLQLDEVPLSFPLLDSCKDSKVLHAMDAVSRIAFLDSLGPQQCEIWAGWLRDLMEQRFSGSEQVEKLRGSFYDARMLGDYMAEAKMFCLNEKSLVECIEWDQIDEEAVAQIQACIGEENVGPLPTLSRHKGRELQYYTRHVIAAAVLAPEGASTNTEIVFNNMKKFLVHAYNRKLLPEVTESTSSEEADHQEETA